MGNERTEAIENEIKKSKEGRTSFYYVDRKKLDRLGIAAYKISTGDNFVRIISPKNTKAFYGREVHIHRDVGANRATFLCLAKMFNKSCPICELIERLKEQDSDDERIKALASGQRWLFFVYDVESGDTEAKGLHWLDSPNIIKDNVVGLSKDKRTKATVDVSDPENGRDIEFVRKGSGKTCKYDSFKLTDNNPIPDEWWKDVPDFDDILLIPTYEQVKKELTGIAVSDPDTPEDEVSDEKPKETRKRTSRTSNGDENSKEETTDTVPEEKPASRERATRTGRSESAGDESTVKARLDEIRQRRTRD